MEKYWGYHLILDCSNCNSMLINDYNTIYNFTKQLVKDIDMVAYGEPQIVHFGSGDKEGYTLVQLIETSNICAHFVPDSQSAYIDVFSCKEYDIEVVKNIVRQYFSPASIRTTFLNRQA